MCVVYVYMVGSMCVLCVCIVYLYMCVVYMVYVYMYVCIDVIPLVPLRQSLPEPGVSLAGSKPQGPDPLSLLPRARGGGLQAHVTNPDF